MATGNFIDYVKVFIRSGNGGAGSKHFFRSKNTPKGGPDGGDGGRGGHIILRGNSQLWTLLHLRYTKHLFAEHGHGGGENLRTGRSGKDLYIDVPLGTIVRDVETNDKLAEVISDGEEVIIFKGGRGGLGNDHFKSATRQTPRFAQPGEAGTEGWVVMELKILADVGLVGFPNAGKSTLLSVVSAAKPEIDNYPFTTLVPNLGIVSVDNSRVGERTFVMADIPGIIEGAAEGKGLGLRFLRHVERNSLLLFTISAEEDVKKQYKILLGELKKYNPELMNKRRILAITKCDLLSDKSAERNIKKMLPENVPAVMISAVAQKGLQELKELIWDELNV
ncbi:MAG: GTPase ObgE [Bacteroidales bacterium]|jgi:GTP-binding protein|nr:GTPase ObgE [Bacteroidales bacterium]